VITVLAESTGYADGAESGLLEMFKGPPVHEYDLYPRDADWATFYHLTPTRKNLLSWIDFGIPEVRMLELGAGCGALTSLFAGRPGFRVTAAEGSLARARVIQRRCGRAGNLDILCGDIGELPLGPDFDVVTMVGVLEYAGAYSATADPFGRALRRAAGHLAPGGVLVLAIENRLGHKYLAGLPEDHHGAPYVGVSGYPGYAGVRTFDRATLGAMLAAAGLTAQAWYCPLPDYKTPEAVLSSRAFEIPGFNALGFFELPSRHPGGGHVPAFNELGFLRGVQALGRAFEFANSFLVLAAREADAPALEANKDLLGVSLNSAGCPRRFQTQARFVVRDTSVVVEREYLHTGDGAPPDNRFAGGRHVFPAREPCLLHAADCLELFVHAMLDSSPTRAVRALGTWHSALEAMARPDPDGQLAAGFDVFCRRRLGRTVYADSRGAWVAGRFLDAHPGNAFVLPTGEVEFIDLEWRLAPWLPLQLVADRGFNLAALTLARYKPWLPGEWAFLPAEVQAGLAGLWGWHGFDADSMSAFEAWFRAAVAHADLDHALSRP
jgi:hypothetical protein